MEIIESNTNEISDKSFKGVATALLENIYAKESNESLIHNDGKLCRDGGDLFDLEHETTDGIYLRRMTLNEGTGIISGIHKRDHTWILLHGRITVSSEDGIFEYSAPFVGFSNSGTQRFIYANEFSIFQNVFKNPENIQDLDKLEDYNYCTTQEEYEEYKKNN